MLIFFFTKEGTLHKKSVKIRNEVVGKEFETNNSGKCFIIDYENSRSVLVMFYSPPFVVKCRMINLVMGKVDNPFYPKHHNKGYMGVGRYSIKNRDAYNCWEGMLRRCYDPKFKSRLKTYETAEVCKEWLNFQNFAEWFYEENFATCRDSRGNRYELDKDILLKGNKLYSPENCCFIPHRINSLIIGCNSRRGSLPIGVTSYKCHKGFGAKLSVNGVVQNLGYFDTPEEAFLAYKKAKEDYIKEVAEDWKDRIDDKTYTALLGWKIEITD